MFFVSLSLERSAIAGPKYDQLQHNSLSVWYHWTFWSDWILWNDKDIWAMELLKKIGENGVDNNTEDKKGHISASTEEWYWSAETLELFADKRA